MKLASPAIKKLYSLRPGTSATALVQVALGVIFIGAQFALALGGLWLLFALFSAGLIAMPALALTAPDVWRGVGSTVADADFDPNRVRRGPTLLAASAFSLSTVLAVALALTVDS